MMEKVVSEEKGGGGVACLAKSFFSPFPSPPIPLINFPKRETGGWVGRKRKSQDRSPLPEIKKDEEEWGEYGCKQQVLSQAQY